MRTLSRVYRALALLTLPAATAACAGLFGPDDDARLRRQLADARAQWERAGPADYRFTVGRGCFCGYMEPAEVVVRGGVPESRVLVDSREPAPDAPYASFDTVDELFSIVSAAIDGGKLERAEYHPQLGYPVSFETDPIKNAIDDEVRYSVTSLQPLQ